MSVDANLPVIYLDSYKVDIICRNQMMDVMTFDRLLPLPDDGGVLIVLGSYSEFCQNLEYGMIYSKAWNIRKNNIQFEVSDPDQEVINGNYTINLNSIAQIVFKSL